MASISSDSDKAHEETTALFLKERLEGVSRTRDRRKFHALWCTLVAVAIVLSGPLLSVWLGEPMFYYLIPVGTIFLAISAILWMLFVGSNLLHLDIKDRHWKGSLPNRDKVVLPAQASQGSATTNKSHELKG